MRIDVHSHYMPQSILADIGRIGDKCGTPLETRPDGKIFIHTPERPYGPVKPTFYDLDLRIEFLNKNDIDKQVLTAPPFLFYYWSNTAEARTLMSIENDAIADTVRRHPDRFIGLATVMLQDVDASIAECERAKKLGLAGVEIGSNVNDISLADERYWKFFEAAEALDMPIYLHPREPAPSMVTPFLDYGLYFAGWGFAAETGLHAMRLIMSGTFDRFPRLKIVLGHMGEGLPFWLQRIDNRYLLEVKIGAVDKLAKLPSQYFLENFVITTAGVTSMPALRLCLDVLGVERILFAADFPYEDDAEAVRFMDGATVTEDERKQIYQTNAERIFKLKA